MLSFPIGINAQATNYRGKKGEKKYWYTKHIAVDANEIVTLRAEWFVLENILLWRTWYIRSGNLIYARIRIARAKVEW